MAKTKAKKSIKAAKAGGKGPKSAAKKPSKAAAAKKSSKRPAAKRASSSPTGSAPASTDIRQAYKNFLLADYLGEKKNAPRAGRKAR